jgi:hypothetical protein
MIQQSNRRHGWVSYGFSTSSENFAFTDEKKCNFAHNSQPPKLPFITYVSEVKRVFLYMINSEEFDFMIGSCNVN